ncbi:hypothetical protein ACROYT_G008944 [Oculina patagonica]
MSRSSYFKISSQEDFNVEEDFSIATSVHDEFSCASMCTSTTECRYALFDKDSKKCSLVKATKKLNRQDTEQPDSGKLLLEKVTIAPNSNQDCASVEMDKSCATHVKHETNHNKNDDDDDADDNINNTKTKTTRISCSDNLQKNSSSPTGVYNITVSNVTWATLCQMNGIAGCGGGAWELVMRFKGGKDTFAYDSRHWTSKESLRTFSEQKQIKLPGYWLSNFTKICVTMHFPANGSRNATLLMNHTARSLYSVLHDGAKKTLPADLTTIETPPDIDKSCLIQGFNMHGPYPWAIKSRVGVESQHLKCPLPYLVRGVGIGFQGDAEMSCGELIIRHSYLPVETYPALCKVFIQ